MKLKRMRHQLDSPDLTLWSCQTEQQSGYPAQRPHLHSGLGITPSIPWVLGVKLPQVAVEGPHLGPMGPGEVLELALPAQVQAVQATKTLSSVSEMHIYESKFEYDNKFIYTDVFYSETDKLFYISQCKTDKEQTILSTQNTELTLGQIAKISEAAGRVYLMDFLDDYKIE